MPLCSRPFCKPSTETLPILSKPLPEPTYIWKMTMRWSICAEHGKILWNRQKQEAKLEAKLEAKQRAKLGSPGWFPTFYLLEKPMKYCRPPRMTCSEISFMRNTALFDGDSCAKSPAGHRSWEWCLAGLFYTRLATAMRSKLVTGSRVSNTNSSIPFHIMKWYNIHRTNIP